MDVLLHNWILTVLQTHNIGQLDFTFVSPLAGLGQTSSVACILLCPKTINKFKMVQQSRHQMLKAYSPDIHTVIQAIFNDSLPFLDLGAYPPSHKTKSFCKYCSEIQHSIGHYDQ